MSVSPFFFFSSAIDFEFIFVYKHFKSYEKAQGRCIYRYIYTCVCVCAPSPPQKKRRVRVSWTHKDLKFLFFFFDAAASPPSCTPIVVPLFLRKLEHNSYFRSQTILILIYIYIVVCLFCLRDSNTHTHTHTHISPSVH